MPTDDNMHDPRRPEVPKADPMAIARDAVAYVRSIRGSDMPAATRALVALLESMYESGAIAGMAAQYKHDQRQVAGQR